MKGFASLLSVVIAAAAFVTSCSKDEPTGTLSFDVPAVYLAPEESITVGYSTSNISPNTVKVSLSLDGWDPAVVNTSARTVTITAPKEFSDKVVKTGTLSISGTPDGGTITSTKLFVAVVPSVDKSAEQANSYLISGGDTHYLFDAMHKGDGKEELSTARLGVVWQSAATLIQYLQLDKGKASFFVSVDSDDAKKIKQGNAVIGAFDAAGNLIWSWHVWAADYDLDAAESSVLFNGFQLMNRNLGALNNANGTNTEILNSYGLYYQWGRKDPFIYPSTFESGESASAPTYDASGTRVRIKTVASSAETGTMAYATQHPTTFIQTSNKDADWMWTGNEATPRWSDASKSVNDPCPYGWMVAPSAAFDNVTIKNDLNAGAAAYEGKYGWTLTNNGAEALFIAAGRRSYLNGSVQNYFDESLLSRATEMQPWVGYYWTSGIQAGDLSSAFCFWFRKDNVADSGVRNSRGMGRANGMSVRCVKR